MAVTQSEVRVEKSGRLVALEALGSAFLGFCLSIASRGPLVAGLVIGSNVPVAECLPKAIETGAETMILFPVVTGLLSLWHNRHDVVRMLKNASYPI